MTIGSITESMLEESKEEPIIVESQGAPESHGAPETSPSHSPNESMAQEQPFAQTQQQSRKHGSLSLQVPPNITVAQFSERGSRRSSSSKHS